MNFKVRKYDDVIPRQTRDEVAIRYHRIIRAVNREFWPNQRKTEHGLYVGSYGRGTAVDTSDIDMLMEIPMGQYDRFSDYSGNGQSQFLQAVREAILTTYPNSKIKADGQVVKVDFIEGMKFEVLPAFPVVQLSGRVKYVYPDTNMGGHWKTTDPKSEQQEMSERNNLSNGLIRATCRHIRTLRAEFYPVSHLSGILIDSFVCNAAGEWSFLNGTPFSPFMSSRTYEEALLDHYNNVSLYGLFPPVDLTAPGSGMSVFADPDDWKLLGNILNMMAA